MLDATCGYLVQTGCARASSGSGPASGAGPAPGASSGPAPVPDEAPAPPSPPGPPPYQLRLPRSVLDRLLSASLAGEDLGLRPSSADDPGALQIGTDTFPLSESSDVCSLFGVVPGGANTALKQVGTARMVSVKPSLDTLLGSKGAKKPPVPVPAAHAHLASSSSTRSRPSSIERGRSNLLDASSLAKRAAARGARSASPLVSASPARTAAGSPVKPSGLGPRDRDSSSHAEAKGMDTSRDAGVDPTPGTGSEELGKEHRAGQDSEKDTDADSKGTTTDTKDGTGSPGSAAPEDGPQTLQDQIVHLLAPGPLMRRHIVQSLSFSRGEVIPEPKILQALSKVAHAPAELQVATSEGKAREGRKFDGPLNRRFKTTPPPPPRDKGPASVWDLYPHVLLNVDLAWSWDKQKDTQVRWRVDAGACRSLSGTELQIRRQQIWPDGEPAEKDRPDAGPVQGHAGGKEPSPLDQAAPERLPESSQDSPVPEPRGKASPTQEKEGESGALEPTPQAGKKRAREPAPPVPTSEKDPPVGDDPTPKRARPSAASQAGTRRASELEERRQRGKESDDEPVSRLRDKKDRAHARPKDTDKDNEKEKEKEKEKRRRAGRAVDYTDSSGSENEAETRRRKLVAEYDSVAGEYEEHVPQVLGLRARLETLLARVQRGDDPPPSRFWAELDPLVADQEQRLARLARIQAQIDTLADDSL